MYIFCNNKNCAGFYFFIIIFYNGLNITLDVASSVQVIFRLTIYIVKELYIYIIYLQDSQGVYIHIHEREK